MFKTAIKKLFLFVFLFIITAFLSSLFSNKTVLAEYPSGCLDSNGYWICSCDPTYCGMSCTCGESSYTEVQAKCVRNVDFTWRCNKTTWPHTEPCCGNWSSSGSCRGQGNKNGNCVIVQPNPPYNNIGSCSVVYSEDPLKTCSRKNWPGPPGSTPTPTPTPRCANTNDCGHTGSCQARACDGDSRSSDYTWSNMGCSSDCNACWCGTLIPGVTPRPATPTPTRPPGSTPTPTRPPATPTPCAPSCSVSLSPLSLDIQTGEGELVTANTSVLCASVSQVSFSSGDSNIVQVSPATVGSAPYTVQVHGEGAGNTTITATVTTSPAVGGCTASIPVSVEAGGWFQTQGGDIYTGGNLSNNIPNSAPDPNLSLELDDWPGIISHQDTNGVSLGSGFPSNNTDGHWLAQSEYQGKPYDSFQFFRKKFASQIATENYPEGSGTNAPSEDQVYYAKSSRTLSGDWDIGGDRWIILLVEGDINVNTDIRVPTNSFLALVATGNITFDSAVTQAQGMFISDGTISTSTGADIFEGQGIFAASTISLGRDLGGIQNDTTPAETFIARPDFIMSSYKNSENNVWWFFQRWQELAP